MASSLLDFTLSIISFTLSPGMDTALTLKMSFSGRKAGFGAVSGICTGLLLWGVIAALGLTILLDNCKPLYVGLEWAGALYLSWLGISTIWKTFRRPSQGADITLIKGRDCFRAGFAAGLTTDLLNPQVGLFVMTFFPQFIPAKASFLGRLSFYGTLTAINAGICFVWLALLVMMSSTLGRFIESPRVAMWLERVAGLVFLYYGLKIIWPFLTPMT
ncbi:LysE family translocator [Formicincola oecophyllae]|nr:LysE family translocator [Formicincola oecophyllae]